MNIMTKPNTTAITLPEDDDPYGEIAMEGGGQFGKILKYVKGTWSNGDNEIALGTEFLALVPEALRGYVRFQDRKPVEHRVGLIRERFRVVPRADLGLTDESLWETDKKGDPIDPWSPQTYLPMTHCENGELYSFVGRSAGFKQTFRDLCRAYSIYRKTTMLPVVSLQTDRYNHPDYSWIDIPVLKIERWEDYSGDMSAAAAAPNPDGGAGAKVIGESKPTAVKRPKDDPISTGGPVPKDDLDDADMPVRVDRADDDIPF